jgi:hypothetical protein
MIEVRCDLDLAEETIDANRSGQLRPEHLDRDLAIMLEIVSEIDGCHPTSTELTLNRVAVSQRSFQTIKGVSHVRRPLVEAQR